MNLGFDSVKICYGYIEYPCYYHVKWIPVRNMRYYTDSNRINTRQVTEVKNGSRYDCWSLALI